MVKKLNIGNALNVIKKNHKEKNRQKIVGKKQFNFLRLAQISHGNFEMKQKMKYVWSNIKEHPLWIIIVVVVASFGVGFRAGKYYYEIGINELKDEKSKLQERMKEISIASSDKKESTTILEPTWIHEELPTQFFSGQLLITAHDINAINKIASFEIIFPDQKKIFWENINLSTRKSFAFKNKTYILNVLDMKYDKEVGRRGAKVSIVEKR